MRLGAIKERKSHIFQHQNDGHFVEPAWCAERLFQTEDFSPGIYDPSCGFGTIPDAARAHGLQACGSDLVDRGYRDLDFTEDFLNSNIEIGDAAIVCNPPFHLFEDFVRKALLMTDRVAMIWLVRRLNAARWLQDLPLATVYLLTPRPSMPPGHVIASGQKPGGGTQDFCWLYFSREHTGAPELRWLAR